FDYYKKYIDTRDNLRLEQINNDVTNWQIKYETEKQGKENEKLREDNKFKQAQIDNQKSLNKLLMIILIIALFTFILSILYFRLKRKTQQKIIEQKNELERLNKELEIKNENLEEANRSKDKLFSIISHDLRSPFQAIVGLSDILITEKNSLTEEEIERFIKGINESGKNLSTLTNNILEWSKIQLDKISVDIKEINLKNIFEQLISTYSAQATEKKIKVEISGEAEILINSDKHVLSTILRNLLTNSIKFCKPGGTIKLGAEQNEKSVDVFVDDNGVGISEIDIPKLFDIKANFSTNGTNDEKGTGLGLIICKEFSEILNGTISVKSVINEGTRFTVSLPCNFSL
ncbi:MAG: HAMP domain-containing histidine kinase, partial [Ignavibacteriaceae bacterium]|nr:HAMP domain-containing histidine kinase [Ignavibacteriaceae bacterium]